jgi:hypothetical protein
MPRLVRLLVRPATDENKVTRIHIDGDNPLAPGELLHWLDLDVNAIHEAARTGVALAMEAEVYSATEVAAMPPEVMAKKHFWHKLDPAASAV